ncbi:hypothetical protein E4Z66_11605 [Aliishimia ponticola]|uniref:Dihydroorotate dehydrogenase n=1 Tax=Aliishimia ponticola TaxID=2499833 RepID=A0A4S4NB86_9RHOB|nr:hypothetical protein [Aliishimia ponticola]THH35727.1 hypothetical protein E4Z66_11605 [Aliishimia ponticola]
MNKSDLNEAELDALFDLAREEVPAPDPAFLARIQRDAVTALRTPEQPRRAKAPGLFQMLRASVGGWLGMSGLVTATVAGLWIGVAPPSVLPDPAVFVSLAAGEAAADADYWLGSVEDDWYALEDG